MSKITGVPADELLLAELIQNAKAYGLKACIGYEFKLAKGNSVTEADPAEVEHLKKVAIGVCAMGAARLNKRTYAKALPIRAGIIIGNDEQTKESGHNYTTPGGYDIGMCFQKAMNE